MRLLGLAFLVAASAGVAFAAQEPWVLSDQEHKACDKKVPDWKNWGSAYTRAVQDLAGSNPNLEQVICGLKLVIKKEPSSNPNATNPTSKEQIKYFPYFYLADALFKRKEYAAAKRCIDKDPKAEMLGTEFTRLREQIEVRTARESLAVNAEKLVAWNSNDKAIRLGTTSAEALSRIKDLKEQVGKAGEADLTDQLKKLRNAIVEACESEIKVRAGRISDLGREPWAGTFLAGTERPSVTSCQARPRAPDSLETDSVILALKDCDAAVVAGLRLAGGRKCEDLERKRKAVLDDLNRLKEIAAEKQPGVAPPEPISGLCDPFGKKEVADLAQAFDSLASKYKSLEENIGRTSKEVADGLARYEDEFNRETREAISKLPDVARDCADVLLVRAIVDEMAYLRKQLAESAQKGLKVGGGTGAIARADSVRSRFVEGARQGVKGLLNGGRKADVPEQELKELEAQGNFLNPAEAPIQSLCRSAIAVNSSIAEYWKKNVDALRKESGFQADLVGGVVRACGQLAAPGSVGACEDPALAAASGQLERARKGPAGPASATWVGATQSAIAESNQALAPFHEAVQISLKDLSRFMADVPTVIHEVQPALMDAAPTDSNSPPQLGTRRWTEKVAGEASEMVKQFSAVEPLFKEKGLEGDALRKRLKEAGLDVNVDWMLLERGRETTQKDEEAAGTAKAARVIRDVAVLPLLSQAGRQRDVWKPFLDGARPFATLNLVLRDFAKGDIEAAVVGLRRAEQQPWMREPGRGPALANAVMALILDAESAAVEAAGGDDTVVQSLRREAREKQKAAREADKALRAPKGLFKSQSLQHKLETLLQDPTAG